VSVVGRLRAAAPAVFGLGVIMIGCAVFGRQSSSAEPDWQGRRDHMVDRQIVSRGVRDTRVLKAMRTVPRHLFVPEELKSEAYQDSPLPIGLGQTISQPYIVALMSELLEVGPGDTVLEVGTGSGYQAAVLAAMGVEVFSVEIVPELCSQAEKKLDALGFDSVHVRCGDGYQGWPERAPFDGIIVTAAPERVPDPLLEQLRKGGSLVIPVGAWYQDLKTIRRTAEGFEERSVIPVRFVPMTGEVQKEK
jgi:protein-L-isoaspartate(D-aspartate) O-methyltransferase